jgi:hypothetical protein
MLERIDAITKEVLQPITFVLAYPTVPMLYSVTTDYVAIYSAVLGLNETTRWLQAVYIDQHALYTAAN